MLPVCSSDPDLLPGETRRHATARLLAEARKARGTDRSRIEDAVVRLNLPVARDLARRYARRGVDLGDLQQVACLGLVKSVRAFDPTKAVDLLSFAVPTMRGELQRHFRDHGWTVRPPRPLQDLQARISVAEALLLQELDRAPRPSELARHLGVEESLVVEALAANGCFTPSSLDALTPDGHGALVDRLGAVDPAYETAEIRALLAPTLRSLTERERLVLELRFFRGWTQSEIGRLLGVTQAQVSRLLSATLEKLRERLVLPTAA